MTANENNEYKIIHAICPYVLDIWNVVYNHRILLCYYKYFGELTKSPNIFIYGIGFIIQPSINKLNSLLQ